jgi:cardiolipin synthase (CMP-forming)
MKSRHTSSHPAVKASMTLASKITVLRIVSIPFFVVALLDHHLVWAQIIFSLSVFSDALDGAIARMRGERTPLGAFLDPLADKLLLVVTYIVFSNLGWIPLWVFVAVISRDLLIILGWTVVYILTHNSKIEPRPLGKVTTALQMAVAIARLFDLAAPYYSMLLYLMIAATLLSAGDYVWIGNKRLGELE